MADLDMFFFDLGCAVILLLIALLGAQAIHPEWRVKIDVVGAYLPLKLYSGSGRSLAFQLGSMFSGGVMLSVSFCHLLADSLEDIEEEVEDFPLGPFLCSCGFLATLIIDQVAHEYLDNKDTSQTATTSARLTGDQDIDEFLRLPDGEHDDDQKAKEEIRLPLTTAFVLAAALVFHSVMEGLGLGTEDEIKSSIDLAVAIMVHKGMAAYALGACVIDSNVSVKMYWLILGTFSIASPIGVLVGYAISEFSDSLTSACFTALAAGTFLYVSLMEIIPNELKEKGHKVEKLLALIIGFGLMSIVAIWA